MGEQNTMVRDAIALERFRQLVGQLAHGGCLPSLFPGLAGWTLSITHVDGYCRRCFVERRLTDQIEILRPWKQTAGAAILDNIRVLDELLEDHRFRTRATHDELARLASLGELWRGAYDNAPSFDQVLAGETLGTAERVGER